MCHPFMPLSKSLRVALKSGPNAAIKGAHRRRLFACPINVALKCVPFLNAALKCVL